MFIIIINHTISIQNIILCFLLGLGYLAGGAAAAKFAHDWSPLADIPFVPGSVVAIRNATAASSVSLALYSYYNSISHLVYHE